MNIAGSNLFKDFARPILQSDYETRNNSHLSSIGIMDSVIRYLVKRSNVDVQRVKISKATDKTYNMSIDCRVSGTGPVSSTVSPMKLDLMFDGRCFGRLNLPEMRTSFRGAKVMVHDQTIEILDLAAYKMFVRSVILGDETSFQLDNGDCTISALGLSKSCDYVLDLSMRGMGGLSTTLKKLHRDGDALTGIFEFTNPSPVEIDHGFCSFAVLNDRGERIASLTAELRIVHGKFKVTMQGTLCAGAVVSERARLVGVGTEELSWCHETIQFIDSVFDIKEEFMDVLVEA